MEVVTDGVTDVLFVTVAVTDTEEEGEVEAVFVTLVVTLAVTVDVTLELAVTLALVEAETLVLAVREGLTVALAVREGLTVVEAVLLRDTETEPVSDALVDPLKVADTDGDTELVKEAVEETLPDNDMLAVALFETETVAEADGCTCIDRQCRQREPIRTCRR